MSTDNDNELRKLIAASRAHLIQVADNPDESVGRRNQARLGLLRGYDRGQLDELLAAAAEDRAALQLYAATMAYMVCGPEPTKEDVREYASAILANGRDCATKDRLLAADAILTNASL